MTVTASPPSSPLAQTGLQSAAGQCMRTSRMLGEMLSVARVTGAQPQDAGSTRQLARRLLSVLHQRDAATVVHSRRVAMISVGIAESLGWSAQQRAVLEVAALVHDIGKIGVPDHILLKPGKLSTGEYELIVRYHRVAVYIFQACQPDRELIQILNQLHQHYSDAEDFDAGGGDVHLGARILAVADAYDSLSTRKAFREAHSHEQTMAILREQSGSRFDGNIVQALSRWHDREGRTLLVLEEAGNTAAPVSTDSDDGEAPFFGSLFAGLSLMESVHDGFCVLDTSQRIAVWTAGAERLFERPAEDVLGERMTSDLIPQQSVDTGAVSATDVVLSGGTRLQNRRVQKPDGTWIDIEVQTIPICDADNRICGTAEIYTDRSGSTKPSEYRELKLQAARDPLTAVANRGRLESQLEKMVDEMQQTSGAFPVSVIFLDVDHFKSINDSFGHTIGDRVLVELAKLLQHETYSGEVVGRYGGEEFVLLCPDTAHDDAVRRAERLRQAIEACEINGIGDRQITASFGVAQVELSDSVQEAFERADKWLYHAKQTGRNRVCWSGCDEPDEEAEVAESINATVSASESGTTFETTVIGRFSPEILQMKLATYAEDNHGALLAYSLDGAKLRLGQRGLLPFWGAENERRPVEIEMVFSESNDERRRPFTPVEVHITINAIGWVRRVEVFERRSHSIMHALNWILSVE